MGAAEGGSRDTTAYNSSAPVSSASAQEGSCQSWKGSWTETSKGGDAAQENSNRTSTSCVAHQPAFTTQEVEKVLDSDSEEETPHMKHQTAS